MEDTCILKDPTDSKKRLLFLLPYIIFAHPDFNVSFPQLPTRLMYVLGSSPSNNTPSLETPLWT